MEPTDHCTGFYRSAQPSELNFSFLEKLKLRTVIWVGAEEPSDMLYVCRAVLSQPNPDPRGDDLMPSDGHSSIRKGSCCTISRRKFRSIHISRLHMPMAAWSPSAVNVSQDATASYLTDQLG